MLLKIGLDLDGVFAQFNPAFATVLVATSGRQLIENPDAPDAYPVWNWMKHHGYTNAEVAAAWAAVDANPLWWTTLKPYPHATVVLSSLARKVGDRQATIHYLTSRNSPTAHWQTTRWLIGQHGDWIAPQVCICANAESKGLMAVALGLHVFLDDNADNILAVKRHSPGTICLLYDQPWNRHPAIRESLAGLGISVLTGLAQLLHYIEYLEDTLKESEA